MDRKRRRSETQLVNKAELYREIGIGVVKHSEISELGDPITLTLSPININIHARTRSHTTHKQTNTYQNTQISICYTDADTHARLKCSTTCDNAV